MLGPTVNVNLSEIRKRTVSVDTYIDGLEEPFKEKFLARKRAYKVHSEAIDSLKKLGHNYAVVLFSASWCKDCAENIPVLGLIAQKTGLEIMVFGGLKKDPLNQVCKWRIPPSPPEVVTFEVDKIPLMIVFNVNGTEIGRIVESPKRCPSLEQELCEILSCQQD
jgi:thiol-disulfide isomerase/thioredoxin